MPNVRGMSDAEYKFKVMEIYIASILCWILLPLAVSLCILGLWWWAVAAGSFGLISGSYELMLAKHLGWSRVK